MDKLHLSKEVIARLPCIEYWEELNPELTISEYPFLRDPPALNTASFDPAKSVEQMKREGYFKVDDVLPAERMELMARAIIKLVDEGFPPAMCYLYDEFWQVFRDISPVVSPVFGENYRLSMNRWAWHVPAGDQNAGFAPHRDMIRCPAPVIRTDGQPLIATVWIPLRDVSASHSCMHVLPVNHDPNVPGNMADTTIPRDSIQYIRALPARAGSVMSWNSNALHWGSCASPWTDEPRISIANYLIRSEVSSFSSVRTDVSKPLTFDFRLGIIGLAISHYDEEPLVKQRYSPELIALLEKYKFCEPDEWRFPQPAVR